LKKKVDSFWIEVSEFASKVHNQDEGYNGTSMCYNIYIWQNNVSRLRLVD
jgi:hypothetical protein